MCQNQEMPTTGNKSSLANRLMSVYVVPVVSSTAQHKSSIPPAAFQSSSSSDGSMHTALNGDDEEDEEACVDDNVRKLHPVMYYSRHTTPAEKNYASHELEVLAIVESLDRFRMFVLGKAFRVVTDCAAVVTTKSTTPLIPRIARWWLNLQEYDFELVHRSGAQLAYVDALSRSPVEPAREAAMVTEVATMQLQDPKLKRIIDVLGGKEKAADEQQLRVDYEMRTGRLYRKLGEQVRWVVPAAVRWRVVKNAHDDRGHFGLQKTIETIKNDFWFARIRNNVQSYIDSCVQCAYNKKPGGTTEGQLHVSKTVAVPFRTVHVDHLGPFPRSTRGNQYKYVVVKAVRTTDNDQLFAK